MDAETRQNATEEIDLATAASLLPRRSNGKKVHVRTVQRWMERGCRGVYLAGSKAGNAWYTTRAAIEQFRAQSTARSIRMPQSVPVQLPSEARRRAKKTAASLKAKGFKNYGRKNETGPQVQAVPETA